MDTRKLLRPKDAARILGIGYSTLKQWLYQGKLRSVKTAGGHHRIPESELDRYLHRAGARRAAAPAERRRAFRRISGRNQLVGRVVEIKTSGLMAQITLSIGGQYITSVITVDALRELGLKKGDVAAALIKSTEVMIMRV